MLNREIIAGEGKEEDKLPQQNQVNSSQRILVVDDDFHIREPIARNLIRLGYQVDIAKDGAEGWQALNSICYDLLITDHKMPKVTGLELIEKLRSKEMTLPVILVSGTMPTEELNRRSWLRVDAMLSKPFTIAELLDTVKKFLNAVDSTANSAQLFRDCAMLDKENSQAEKPVNAPIRDQVNPAYRILVVDDDNETRQLIVDLLAGSGYEVEGVNDGVAGWETLRASNFDLVLTDNQMPRMTGVEMIAKLRNARMAVLVIMATRNLPTLIFTHNPWLKPDAMLKRPFANDDLLEVVRNVLHTDGGNDGGKETLLPKYL